MPFAPYTGYAPCSQTPLSCRVEDLYSKQSDKRTLGFVFRTTFCAIPLIKDFEVCRSAIIDYTIDSLDVDFVKFSRLYETAGEGGTPTTSNVQFYDNGKIPFIKIDDLKQKYLRRTRQTPWSRIHGTNPKLLIIGT